MSPVRGGVARRRLAFDTTAAPPARFYILRRRLDAAADAAGASSTDAVVEWLAEDQRSRQCLLRLFPADGVAYDAELAVRLAAPAVALPLLGRDDASRTLVTPRPSLSLLEYAQRERGSPELPPQVWPLARAIVGRVAELHAAGFAHGSLTWRHIALLPPETTAAAEDDDDSGGVGGGDWRLTGVDGCVWCADGGAAGGGGGSSDAPLLATTAELDATAAARAADVEAVGTLALSLLQKGHGGHAADVLIRHAPAAPDALPARRARGAPGAAERAGGGGERARLEGVAAAEEADEAEVRRLIDAVTSGGAASDLALGAVTADQPEALRHLIHDTIVEATLLPPALRTAAADLLPAPIAVRSGGRGLHGAPPPLMPMRANDRMAVRVASAAERGAESLRSLRLASGMRLLLHQAAAAAAPPPGSPRRGAAAARAAAAAARGQIRRRLVAFAARRAAVGRRRQSADDAAAAAARRRGNDADHAVPVRPPRRRRRRAARRALRRHQGDSTRVERARRAARARVFGVCAEAPRGRRGRRRRRVAARLRRGRAAAERAAARRRRTRRGHVPRRLRGGGGGAARRIGEGPRPRTAALHHSGDGARSTRRCARTREVAAAAPPPPPPCRRRRPPAAIRSRRRRSIWTRGCGGCSAWRRACATRRRPSCGAACAHSA